MCAGLELTEVPIDCLTKTLSLCITYYWSFLMVMTKWVLQTAPKLWLAMPSKFTDKASLSMFIHIETQLSNWSLMPELHPKKGEQCWHQSSNIWSLLIFLGIIMTTVTKETGDTQRVVYQLVIVRPFWNLARFCGALRFRIGGLLLYLQDCKFNDGDVHKWRF
jgi:hypothetical protein